MGVIRRKLTIVGDSGCGKSGLLLLISTGTFPEVRFGHAEYIILIPNQRVVPTVFENYVTDVNVDGKIVELALWDTAGNEG
jgi:Ras family protein A